MCFEVVVLFVRRGVSVTRFVERWKASLVRVPKNYDQIINLDII